MKHAREDYNRIQDPYGKIPKDEPVFLVRGQDIAGPGCVEAWANIAELAGADPKIIKKARDQANLMREYQNYTQGKIPDLPE